MVSFWANFSPSVLNPLVLLCEFLLYQIFYCRKYTNIAAMTPRENALLKVSSVGYHFSKSHPPPKKPIDWSLILNLTLTCLVERSVCLASSCWVSLPGYHVTANTRSSSRTLREEYGFRRWVGLVRVCPSFSLVGEPRSELKLEEKTKLRLFSICPFWQAERTWYWPV